MKSALAAIRRQGAARIVVAVPVAPEDTLAEIAALADDVVCLNPSRAFRGVGGFFADFHQLTDQETIGLLRQGWTAEGASAGTVARAVSIPPHDLAGDLALPPDPRGIVLFAHGSGSSRLSPRNLAVAESLNGQGFATLLMDLLTTDEARDRRNVFDIPLLAERLAETALWIGSEPDIADLPLGLFGASTGAGAALLAAAEMRDRIAAVVSRGGRPDLAGARLAQVHAPTLLIVGGDDEQVIALNRKALASLTCEKLLRIVPGAGHLFEEPGTLEQVTELAGAWFQHYLAPAADSPAPPAMPPSARQPPMETLRAAAIPLPALEDADFAAAFDRFADARVVLLGEASHGTSEFYRARAAITRRLIERHGFRIVAVEADWSDAAAIDRHVRHLPPQPMRTPPFTRFPTWMWRNKDVDAFVGFLRQHNAAKPPEERAGFHGLDLYNMNASIAAVLGYLDSVDPAAAAAARRRYGCLDALVARTRGLWARVADPGLCPVRGTGRADPDGHAPEGTGIRRRDGERFFDAAQNARLIVDAERYYRFMYYGSHDSWNLRDSHMFDTLQRHAGMGRP